jgi:hypothetical protein
MVLLSPPRDGMIDDMTARVHADAAFNTLGPAPFHDGYTTPDDPERRTIDDADHIVDPRLIHLDPQFRAHRHTYVYTWTAGSEFSVLESNTRLDNHHNHRNHHHRRRRQNSSTATATPATRPYPDPRPRWFGGRQSSTRGGSSGETIIMRRRQRLAPPTTLLNKDAHAVEHGDARAVEPRDG